MCQMLICDPGFYRIDNGLVHYESVSGDQAVRIAAPIAVFRASLAEGQRVLDEFDAERRVLVLRE